MAPNGRQVQFPLGTSCHIGFHIPSDQLAQIHVTKSHTKWTWYTLYTYNNTN